MSHELNFTELKNDFIEKYTKNFLPVVSQVKKKRKTVNIILIIMCALALVALLVLAFYKDNIVKAVSLALAVIFAFASYKLLNVFKEKARDEIMQNYVKTLDAVAWRWGKYPEKMLIKRACLVNYFENATIFNTFFGTHNSIDWEAIECNFKNKITIFEGLIIRIKLNTNSDVHTVIRLDNANFAATRPTLRPINADEFGVDKKYHVYSEDSNVARAHIQEGFIEQLEVLAKSFNLPFVAAAFCKGDLLIAFKNKKQLFDMYPVLKDKPQAFEQFSDFFKDVVAIGQLIDFYKDKK